MTLSSFAYQEPGLRLGLGFWSGYTAALSCSWSSGGERQAHNNCSTKRGGEPHVPCLHQSPAFHFSGPLFAMDKGRVLHRSEATGSRPVPI